jgi:hypothetical protein
MSGGKLAARAIDVRLMGEDRWNKIFPNIEFSQQPPAESSLSHRHHAPSIPAAERVCSQQEVVGGLEPQDALEEAQRCLRCDLRAVAHY